MRNTVFVEHLLDQFGASFVPNLFKPASDYKVCKLFKLELDIMVRPLQEHLLTPYRKIRYSPVGNQHKTPKRVGGAPPKSYFAFLATAEEK